ncbi:hypothetical protein B296_00043625, partial [Ensete ventricosum]
PVSLPLTLVLFLTLFSAALPGGSGHPAGGEQQLTAGARSAGIGLDRSLRVFLPIPAEFGPYPTPGCISCCIDVDNWGRRAESRHHSLTSMVRSDTVSWGTSESASIVLRPTFCYKIAGILLLEGMDDEFAMASALDEKTDNDDACGGDAKTNIVADRTPTVGMKFKSYEEALEFYRDYARLVGFSARLKRTNYNKFGQYQSVEFICSRGGKGRADDPSYLCRPTAKTNCQATILLKLRADGLLHVKKAILEHNHPMDPSKIELKKRRKKMSYALPKHDENNGKIMIRRLKRFQSPFKEFQDELKATMYCNVSLVKEEVRISTYDIKESLLLEDGNPTEHRDFRVLYSSNELEVQCCCGSFQFRGILCRHALSVLKLQQVYEIPSRYVIDRWRKDIKLLHTISYPTDEMVANNRLERYDNLLMSCLQLVEVGITSNDRYHLALKMIGEVEKFLSNDKNSGNTNFMILPSDSRTPENPENVGVQHLVTSAGNKIQNSSQIKRRGRPPKKKVV